MTSSPHGPYVQGYTRATMGGTKGCEPARGSQSQKAALSSDRRLQLGSGTTTRSTGAPLAPQVLAALDDQHCAALLFSFEGPGRAALPSPEAAGLARVGPIAQLARAHP